MLPSLSVCVTMRNAAPFIEECLDSVAEQTYPRFECLVMDDASDDGTQQVLRDHSTSRDPRFHFFYNDERRFVPSTTKHLIERATGEVIVWIGGDDKFSGPHALGRIARAYMANPLVDATYGSFLSFPTMAPWPMRLLPPGYPWYDGWCVSHVLTWRRSLSLTSFAEEWHSPAYRDENDEPYRTAGDVSLFFPIMFRARSIAFIPDVIYLYRQHLGNDDAIDRDAQKAVERRVCAYWKSRVLAQQEAPLVR